MSGVPTSGQDSSTAIGQRSLLELCQIAGEPVEIRVTKVSRSGFTNDKWNYPLDRAILNWVSKVNHDCIGFASLRSVIGSKILRHLLYQSDAKLKPRFPALEAGYPYLLWVLIGYLWNFLMFWLAIVMILVLLLRHSNGKAVYHNPAENFVLLKRFTG